MRKMKKNGLNRKINIAILVIAMMLAMITGCAQQKTIDESANNVNESAEVETTDIETTDAEPAEENVEEVTENEEADSDIIIVYTNDVHSYIGNVIKDSDGNITGDGLRFSKVAAMVNDMRDAGKNVLLVDAGDEIQGDIYGAMDEGENIIKIMKATGYQLATPGNHDFDYGVLKLLKLAESAGFPYITCNFHSTKTKEITFTDSYIFDIGGKKVAFVGVSTPSTITSSTPTYFQDEKGEFIYTIDGLNNTEDLYTSVQNAINNVREEADYVIGIGHLGVGLEAQKMGWDSETVIKNVVGLDAFIDGHSHTTMEGNVIKDKEGNEVILTQTGFYLSAVGKMTISSDGTISTELITDYDREDETVAKMEKEWIDDINTRLEEKIGVLENKLYINNPDDDSQRLIRSRELNLGDFVADATYWYFNEKLGIDCDVAFINGGGLRAPIDAGDLSILSAKTVEPFGNMICLITTKGQHIIDALEMGVNVIGEWNDEWSIPAENGGFMHVAGLKYTIDATIPSNLVKDENGMFDKIDGDYRVKDVEIYNRQTKKYEPIDPDKEYQLSGINYLLRNDGNGLNMFDSDELTVDYVGEDYIILSEYIKSFKSDGEYAIVNTKNSPLSSYKGYLLDYENPYGSGRINIILE